MPSFRVLSGKSPQIPREGILLILSILVTVPLLAETLHFLLMRRHVDIRVMVYFAVFILMTVVNTWVFEVLRIRRVNRWIHRLAHGMDSEEIHSGVPTFLAGEVKPTHATVRSPITGVDCVAYRLFFGQIDESKRETVLYSAFEQSAWQLQTPMGNFNLETPWMPRQFTRRQVLTFFHQNQLQSLLQIVQGVKWDLASSQQELLEIADDQFTDQATAQFLRHSLALASNFWDGKPPRADTPHKVSPFVVEEVIPIGMELLVIGELDIETNRFIVSAPIEFGDEAILPNRVKEPIQRLQEKVSSFWKWSAVGIFCTVTAVGLVVIPFIMAI